MSNWERDPKIKTVVILLAIGIVVGLVAIILTTSGCHWLLNKIFPIL